MKTTKESRKNFERISSELDTAYIKNADASKQKPTACEETDRNLCGVKRSYGHASLEYTCHLNRFYLKRGHSVLDIVKSFSFMQSSFENN